MKHQEKLLNPSFGQQNPKHKAPKVASIEAEETTSKGDFIALDTIVIGNSIKYYFLVFLPSFVLISLVSLKGLKYFYATFPEIHFLLPLALWLLFFIQTGMNLARFVIEFLVISKSGRIVLEGTRLTVDGELIDIKAINKITFHYRGDANWNYPKGIFFLFGLNKRHRHLLSYNAKELYDYVEIDKEAHYVQIRNAKDKEIFFNMSKRINEQTPRLAFLIQAKL